MSTCTWELTSKEGYDGQLVITDELNAYEPVEKGMSTEEVRKSKGLKWEKKSRESVLFHELSEMYYRTEGNAGKGMSYEEADKKATNSDKKSTYPGIGTTKQQVETRFEGTTVD